jgi:hypothetical protein
MTRLASPKLETTVPARARYCFGFSGFRYAG